MLKTTLKYQKKVWLLGRKRREMTAGSGLFDHDKDYSWNYEAERSQLDTLMLSFWSELLVMVELWGNIFKLDDVKSQSPENAPESGRKHVF